MRCPVLKFRVIAFLAAVLALTSVAACSQTTGSTQPAAGAYTDTKDGGGGGGGGGAGGY